MSCVKKATTSEFYASESCVSYLLGSVGNASDVSGDLAQACAIFLKTLILKERISFVREEDKK